MAAASTSVAKRRVISGVGGVEGLDMGRGEEGERWVGARRGRERKEREREREREREKRERKRKESDRIGDRM
jgi:hypothetical protein